MNEEDRLAIELKYGIDLSYDGLAEYFIKVRFRLPEDFLSEYGYVDEHHLTSIYTSVHAQTIAFKAKLIQDLLEYKNE